MKLERERELEQEFSSSSSSSSSSSRYHTTRRDPMKILFRLFAFALLLLPALAACSGSDANTETATSDPSGPVVRIYYPPT
jgi:hypothetical protein